MNRHLNNAIAMNEGNIKVVLQSFYTVFREYPMGIKSDLIEKEISRIIGQDFNIKHYGCQSVLEFLKKFVMPTIEIEVLYSGDADREENFIIRSKQCFM